MQPPRAGAQFGGVDRAGFVDVDRRFVQPAQRFGQTAPFFVVQPTIAQLALIEPADRRQKPRGQLRAGHFQTEDRHRLAQNDADMLGNVHRKSGFTHRRPPGDDDHVAALQAGSHTIQIDEASRQPADVGRVVARQQRFHALDHLAEQGLDRHEAALVALA